MRMKMRWIIRAAVSVAFAVTLIIDPAVSVVRKCFSCRSRGPLGDCRDPFYLSANATIIESKKSGVETPPCSSGWCRKVIEGRENREGGHMRVSRTVLEYLKVRTDMQENMWARLRDSHPGACLIQAT